ncbi:metallothionein-2-like [Musca domestica]|uniref:Metallothionein-2-like n=1 Tax=Musca domestica TaxID=7370 RepID=A0A9J7HZ18_MUSDO|nr:metallothionein-2-like [Musca domestica]
MVCKGCNNKCQCSTTKCGDNCACNQECKNGPKDQCCSNKN